MANKIQNDQSEAVQKGAKIEADIVSDTQYRGLMAILPSSMRDYALLARFDRPIGWWLLFWPCAWGLALAGGAIERWDLLLWLLLGAIVMRSAGCVYNDIIDRDLDSKVTRTAARPIASGRISPKAAALWLLILCLIGLLVLLQLNLTAQIMALSSLLLVAAYPFMKRITWWPQAWLGMVFSWGVLVAWLQIVPILLSYNLYPMLALYLGSIFWVIGFDTIYALQDVEDDALVGVRSSALRLEQNVRLGVGIFYILALVFWLISFWLIRSQMLVLLAIIPMALHLIWQVVSLKDDNSDALEKFRSNRFAGLLLFLACLTIGQSA